LGCCNGSLQLLCTASPQRLEFAYGCQGLIFVPATYRLLKNDDGSSTENVEDLREDLTVYEMLVSLPLMRFAFDGRRTLYGKGVAARGTLTVLSATDDPKTPDIPPNHFFSPGRQFRVETRFSNCLHDDDAAMDIRGCALRLRAIGSDDTFDLLMATGSFSPVRCLKDVRKLSRRSLTKRIAHDRVLRSGMTAGMRRAPDSYTSLSYYNQIVLEWLLPGSEHRLVRLRLVPVNSAIDGQGFPDIEDLPAIPGGSGFLLVSVPNRWWRGCGRDDPPGGDGFRAFAAGAFLPPSLGTTDFRAIRAASQV
jgi:hypothetical protein